MIRSERCSVVPMLPSLHVRRLELLVAQVGGNACDSCSSEATAPRMLRSAWQHNSLELSDREVSPRGHRVLTDADHDFLAEHGWLLVRGAVPPETVSRCVDDTWKYLHERWGMRPDDPSSWYHPQHMNGHVKKYQSQGQWDIRQCPAVHAAFADLWGTEELWCSVDSTHMNPPARDGVSSDLPGIGALHIDVPIEVLQKGTHFRVQGEVLLTDVTSDGGGFSCVVSTHRHDTTPAEVFGLWAPSRTVPGFHKAAADWARNKPDSLPLSTSTLELHPDLVADGYEVITPAGNAGDLLIWDYFLPHSNSPNRSQIPRLVQIVTMFPVEAHTPHKTGTYGGVAVSLEEERRRRVTSWQHGVDVCAFIGGWSPDEPLVDAAASADARYILSSYDDGAVRQFPAHKPARLTALGKKLLGLKRW